MPWPCSDREVLYQLSHGQSMAAVSYCPDCGTANPSNLVACSLCGLRLTSTTRKNPVNSYTLRAKPMAVFDIDMTLLDNEQRYKDAKRAGIIDKDGKPKERPSLKLPVKHSSEHKSSSSTQLDSRKTNLSQVRLTSSTLSLSKAISSPIVLPADSPFTK